ncbi:MAG: AAA family ATPase, partial [Bacteroidia bacterium]
SEDLVFKIDEIEFIKTNTKESVAYKQLSDGEHQLLHVMGTLNLMSENDVFFILDEPETHFNPEWRAKMVKMIINNSEKDLEQDYFITSHSPFIISDCKPNNVYIFNKTPEGIKVETASQKRLNTFGTSVNILTDEIFNKNESIADYSLFKLNEIKNRKFNSLKAIQKAKEDSRLLGESVEKVLLFRKLITIEEKLKAKTVKKASPVKKSVNKRKTTLSPTTKRAIKPQTAKSTNKKKILTKPATTKNRSKRTKRSSIKKANNRRRSK